MKQKMVGKSKKRLLDLYHKTKEVGFDGYGQPKSKKRTRVDDLFDVTQASPSLINRVLEVEQNLNPNFPFFVKSMNRSAVTIVFLLKLPRAFCDLHMPGYDASIVLVDTSEKNYQTKYLAEKKALSARWKAFSIAHRLIEGDVLIFQLVKPCEFKVYIVRTSELDEVDGAVALMHLKGDGRHCNSGIDYAKNSANSTGTLQDKGGNLEHLPPGIFQENVKKDVGFLLEEIIIETLSIVNAARASNQLASRVKFASSLDECSKAFEQSQANIGSLRTQMDRLDTLAIKAKDAVESEKERRRESGEVCTEEEKKALVVKLLKLMEAKLRLGGEIESLKAHTSRLELMCQKEADNNPNYPKAEISAQKLDSGEIVNSVRDF